MQEIILIARYFERGLSKSLKKGTFLSFEPSPFNRQNYQKQGGLELVTTSGYSGYEISSEKFLISYVLSDQV